MALSFLSWSFAVLIFLADESRACNVNAIRLAGGQNRFEGRVELCHNGQWKRVCIYGWFGEEANVACRQLGFSGSLTPAPERYNVRFGPGFGDALKVFWNCRGTENFLLNCPTVDASFCNHPHELGAGVYCFGKVSRQCNDGEITLRNGDLLEGSGRVEVCLGGLWGTVCDDGWDINDATTVCRQLGYSNPTGIPTRGAYFGEGGGPIHLSRAQCSSRDTRLMYCNIDNTGMNRCTHSEDAGVICMGRSDCEDFDVRLVGGECENEGRVEICYNGVWGTVCDDGWDEVDANVICQQLGYSHSTIAIPVMNSGPGAGPVLLNNVSCTHDSTEISQCVHPLSIGIHHCSKTHMAGVRCQRIVSSSTVQLQSLATNLRQRIISSSIVQLQSLATSLSILDISNSASLTHECIHLTTSVFPMQTRADATITPTAGPPSEKEALPGILILAIGLALAVGVIATIVLVLMVVVRRQREKKRRAQDNDVAGKGSPNAQACIDATLTTVVGEDEREFQNPLYGIEMDTNITSLASIQNIYEGLHGSTRNSEHLYDQTADYYSVPRSLINGWSYNNNGDIRGHMTTSEAIYDVPPASDVSDHDYDDCFPELDMEGANESEL